MKKSFWCLLLILCFGCYNVERNCEDYKTGEYYFYYTVDGIKKQGRFERTEELNIDYFDGKIDSASVRWINDCEFILKKINPKTRSEEQAIHMKILSTTDSSYTFEYKLAIKPSNKALKIEKGIAYKLD